MILDQYGDPVPSDLVLLVWSYVTEDKELLSEADLVIADQLYDSDWYEILTPDGRKFLTISWGESENIIRGDPYEVEEVTDPRYYTAMKVAKSLHRYNSTDGFFHA